MAYNTPEKREAWLKSPAGVESVRKGRAKYLTSPQGRAANVYGNVRRRYGLSKEVYDAMLAACGGRCGACAKVKKLSVDHCHVTGKVRGLLCIRCNAALAAFGDCSAGLRRAYEYLERFDFQS